jgi:hypothetical protein
MTIAAKLGYLERTRPAAMVLEDRINQQARPYSQREQQKKNDPVGGDNRSLFSQIVTPHQVEADKQPARRYKNFYSPGQKRQNFVRGGIGYKEALIRVIELGRRPQIDYRKKEKQRRQKRTESKKEQKIAAHTSSVRSTSNFASAD